MNIIRIYHYTDPEGRWPITAGYFLGTLEMIAEHILINGIGTSGYGPHAEVIDVEDLSGLEPIYIQSTHIGQFGHLTNVFKHGAEDDFKREKLRTEALAKLSPAERAALGVG